MVYPHGEFEACGRVLTQLNELRREQATGRATAKEALEKTVALTDSPDARAVFKASAEPGLIGAFRSAAERQLREAAVDGVITEYPILPAGVRSINDRTNHAEDEQACWNEARAEAPVPPDAKHAAYSASRDASSLRRVQQWQYLFRNAWSVCMALRGYTAEW